MQKLKLQPIIDQYYDNRESKHKFLDVYCKKCGKYILTYQKDGPGPFKRMYLDRIHYPTELTGLDNVDDVPDLKCPECDRYIAVCRVYHREVRRAYFVFAYTAITKESNGYYPPEFDRVEVD